MSSLVSSCKRPAIIIAPPDGSSTEVSARRTVRLGMVRLAVPAPPAARVRAPCCDNSETSVEIFSEIRPLDSTTGVKPRPTPKGLNSTLTLPVVSSPVGTGNSPPARNLADSPDTAVRLGSARTRTRPTLSKAWIEELAWLRRELPAVDAIVAALALAGLVG